MSTSSCAGDCSHEKEVKYSEIKINVENVRSAQRHPECCIYKVPSKLRMVKQEAYTPMLISIGPVHNNKKELDNKDHHKKEQDNKTTCNNMESENMESLKLKDFKEFFCQTICNNKELENMESLKLRYFKEFFSQRTWKSQEEFIDIIAKRGENIRNCYAEEISLPEEKDFLKMILLDSIFIIELFLRTAARKTYEKDDYILSKPWLEEGIKRDLILLENQLPFFILDELYHQIGSCTGFHNSFLSLAWIYFFPNDSCKNIPEEKEVKHFTDLHRHFYHHPNQKISDRHTDQPLSATKLDTAGLIFQKWEPNDNQKPEENQNKFLLDIQYKSYDKNLDKKNLTIFPCISCSWLTDCLKKFLRLKCLVIPEFAVDDRTEELFRNLMALEQFHYPYEAYICNYIILLDFLINSEEDVELLIEKKIIVNLLGSNEVVAKMINKLCLEIVETKSYYSEVADDLVKYYKRNWNKNIGTLKNVYFRDIWRGTATVVGVVVLLITILNFLQSFVFKSI